MGDTFIRLCSRDLERSRTIDGGHFLPEEVPNETAEAPRRFFLGGG
jgi:hypothetical protein